MLYLRIYCWHTTVMSGWKLDIWHPVNHPWNINWYLQVVWNHLGWLFVVKASTFRVYTHSVVSKLSIYLLETTSVLESNINKASPELSDFTPFSCNNFPLDADMNFKDSINKRCLSMLMGRNWRLWFFDKKV